MQAWKCRGMEIWSRVAGVQTGTELWSCEARYSRSDVEVWKYGGMGIRGYAELEIRRRRVGVEA